MQVDRIFNLFDSLVTPVATYCSPLWLPFIVPRKCFENSERLMDFWEKFKCETLNQKCAKMTLSVHKKTPRLAVLGELGRFPLFLQSLALCLNYKLSLLARKNNNILIGNALREMDILNKKSSDNWLGRVDQFESLLKIPRNLFFSKSSGKKF